MLRLSKGFHWLTNPSANQKQRYLFKPTRKRETLTDNTTYQDWIAQGSEWNEEKSIYMFNFKCPAPGDIGNDIAPNMC